MKAENTKNYYNIRPVVIVATGFIFGIITAYLYLTEKVYLSLCLLVVGSLCALAVLGVLAYKRKVFTCALIAVTIILYVFGFFYTLIRTDKVVNSNIYGNQTFNSIITEIKSETTSENGYVYELVLETNDFKIEGLKINASAYCSDRLFTGTKLKVNANLYKIKIDNFSISTNVYYGANSIEIIENYGISGVFYKLKHKLVTLFEKTMPNVYGTNYALLTGDTQYISETLLTKYRQMGIAHVFAVSGLHIGLMYLLLSTFLKAIKVKPKLKVLIVIPLLTLYVAFCGFTPSSLRAFIIISVAMLAGVFGLKPDSSSSLFLSALIVLLINPCDLLSVGFQLSFVVYLGLTVLSAPFSKLLSRFISEKVASVLSPYIVAHLVSFPIILDAFSFVQPLAFALNLVIVPIISFLYGFSLILAVLQLIFQSATIFTVIPKVFLGVINKHILSVDTSVFLIENFKISYSMPFYYGYLYLLSGKINFSAKTLKILRIIFLSLFILVVTLLNI
ncbi:MAG: ComEC/Rec2 family competence protein [Clostridia bacterium]|nr:ComEC/Rec2 family competence protein [Clostridia bacterium]